VCCPKRPDWGLGRVLADDGGAKVTVFFVGGGTRRLDTTIVELDLVTGAAAINPILDVAEHANWQNAHHKWNLNWPDSFAPIATLSGRTSRETRTVRCIFLFSGER